MLNKIPLDFDFSKRSTKKPIENEVINHVVSWMVLRPALERFFSVRELLEAYGIERDSAKKDFDRFLELVSRFLGEEGKTLSIDKVDSIAFRVSGSEENRPITTLSSGEAQIFVILSHLFFNPAAQRANVFIVDEPELSLHVEWQELFVSAIEQANLKIQYILATHSPSIIQDRIRNCRTTDSGKRAS